ncbi:hypothetical protein ACPW96_20135 [Micromonospora sp. DT81.3]|uniref:hypothetical protein n=1 Tax=Micromonospora sp. DT81.3 TaxID=3416523 RepID=UPI003CF84215
MNPRSTPVSGETLAEAGERIRAACPIQGATATNDECRNRSDLIDETLQARGVQSGVHAWHTAQLDDGHIAGVFANSLEEAELDLTIWWGERCHWVVADPHCRVFHEYFPKRKRSAATANTRFPLGPPRRARDQFAPTQSLLEGSSAPPASRQAGLG